MKDNEPLVIIIILFIILGFAYEPIKNSNNTPLNIESGSTSSIGANESLGYSQNENVASDLIEVEESVENLEKTLEQRLEEAKRSPFYNKVRMSYISGVYSNDPNQEYISLYTSLDKTETVNITGWYFKSDVTGYYATIGKASLLPFPFAKSESDVILTNQDRVIVTKGFSPIGISFRTNICTGYFEENRTFNPSLPLECPLAEDENLPKFSDVYDRNDECLDIIERIPRCTTVNSSFLRDLPDTVPSYCKNYMTASINYNACVAKHFGDTDFPGNEYRIYLNKFGPLWRTRREKITLYDRNGLIVDSINYD